MANIQFNREKFKDVVHFVCSKFGCDELGAVKLHKILYFSDMIRYALEGSPLTGAVYRKRPFGPTADFLLRALDELEREGRVRVYEKNFYGYRKKCFESLVKPDTSRFCQEELELIDDIAEFVCLNCTARTISEFSHHAAWLRTDAGEEIPYYSAIELFPADISDKTWKWAEGEQEEVEKIRSDEARLDYESFSAFRGRVLEAQQSVSRPD